MVKLFLTLFLIACTNLAQAVTPEELQEMSANTNREEIQRSNRANTGAVDTLLPAQPKQPTSSKYNTTKNPDANESTAKPVKKNAHKNNHKSNNLGEGGATAASNTNIYVPPPRQGGTGGQQVVSDAVPATLVFGIRLGSWMKANLNRDTNSAEPGTVELSLSEDVIGDHRTLPIGTILFANKILNSATKRMEMTVTHGIIPSGQEFTLRGIVFDPQKISGLSGNYVVDDKAVAKHGVQKGTVAAIGAAAQSMGGANPLAAAGGAATQSVITDTGGAVDYNAPTAVIYVPPQPLIIRVEEKF